MDCDKFDPLLLDELYDELDELTSAAVNRHVAGCARCAGALDELRATRRAAELPMVPLPAGLEERILAAAKEAKPVVPIRSRLSRAISVAGTWAMRPQTAMAAVFLLMIGTSAFLIRSKTHSTLDKAVSITVQGEPAPLAAAPSLESLDDTAAASAHGPGTPTKARAAAAPLAHAEGAARAAGREKAEGEDLVAQSARPAEDETLSPPAALAAAEAAPTAGPSTGAPMPRAEMPQPVAMAKTVVSDADEGPFSLGAAAFRARNFPEATRQFDIAAQRGDTNAALWAAESVREGSGCARALPRFEQLARSAAGSWVGSEASLRAARCQMELGQLAAARERLNALAQVPSHKEAALKALGELDPPAKGGGGAVGGGAVAAPRQAAPSREEVRDPAPAGTVSPR